MREIVISVPNILGTKPGDIEKLINILPHTRQRSSIVLDMTAVTWIHPYGAISLLSVCHHLRQFTSSPICLTGLNTQIHAYLRRINFFTWDINTVISIDSFSTANDFERNPASHTVLELMHICINQDAILFALHARRILSSWLSNANDDINRIITLVSEACSNVIAHSGDDRSGIAMIQKYERQTSTDIELAISDLGQGIRQSLLPQYNNLDDTCGGFIARAIDGLSAGSNKRQGQGLGSLQRIAIKSEGSLYIRSEQGSVLTTSSGRQICDNLSFFPGTQISIKFCTKSTLYTTKQNLQKGQTCGILS